MEQDNFNKNIQEKFNFRTIEPSETAWNKLDAMLTLAEEKKQPKIFFWLSIAATFLLFTGVGYVFFQQNEKTKLMPSTEEIVTSKTNSETETQKQSMKESSVSFENELANNPTISTTSESKKSTTIYTAQNENSKLEVYEMALLKQEEVITANEIKKEGIKQEIKEPTYNYPTAETLLAEVQGEKKPSNTVSFKSSLRVNPNELLQAVESELDQTFKEKTITKLKQAKSVFVNRNYN
ncbi:hypothetical protein [Flavobacterium sp.]|uniref:hypothetical protein n=1 Tax=Flavobacterium sp. TaxID=239 RepID=UPI001B3EC9F6|nr:hypothetical protein [Flavobacterium sp.]MBP6126907.1 hypothetical protein [Flavobacterium sp.]